MSGVARVTLLRGRIAKVGDENVLFQKPGGATVMTELGVVEMLNRMSGTELIERLSHCCSLTAWCDTVARRWPFADRTHLHRVADWAFETLSQADGLQAFAAHPKIGNIGSLRIQFGGDADWSQAVAAAVYSALK